MTNEVRMIAHGVKCDAAGCDVNIPLNSQDEYVNYVNMPCPKCGANLLTEEDFEAMMQVLSVMEVTADEAAMDAYLAANPLPEEIQALINQLDTPEVQAHLNIDIQQGVPIMTTDNPEVQVILDKIQEYSKRLLN